MMAQVGLHRTLGNYRVVSQLVASRVVLSSTGLVVSYIILQPLIPLLIFWTLRNAQTTNAAQKGTYFDTVPKNYRSYLCNDCSTLTSHHSLRVRES
jgi:hypothetical protein